LTIGGIAFIVDISVYLVLTEILSLNSIYSRIIAFLIAVCITCIGNKTYTFSERPKVSFVRQYGKALLAATISFLPNILLFWLLLILLPSGVISSLIAFTVGTGAGIILNYLLSNHYVFTAKLRV